jgi:hypothetical protein
MLGWLAGVHEPAFAPVNVRGRPPIDNNPTPSYLSVNFGWLHFAPAFRVDFARKEPHSGAPEA